MSRGLATAGSTWKYRLFPCTEGDSALVRNSRNTSTHLGANLTRPASNMRPPGYKGAGKNLGEDLLPAAPKYRLKPYSTEVQQPQRPQMTHNSRPQRTDQSNRPQ